MESIWLSNVLEEDKLAECKNKNEEGDTMNEVIKAMKERRSIRKFKSEMPKKEALDQIIEIGHCAVGYTDGDSPEAAPRKESRVFWVE